VLASATLYVTGGLVLPPDVAFAGIRVPSGSSGGSGLTHTEYVRSKYPHRLGIQLDVDRTGRTGPDTDMLIDWVRVSNVK
jgi:hypothetical protein